MHKNTLIFIGLLATIAALLLGINIGRRINVNPQAVSLPTSQPLASPLILPSASPQPRSFAFSDCGITFAYDPQFSLSTATSAAQLINQQTQVKISLACAAEIPKPPLPKEQVEDVTVDEVKAKLYHDRSAKDGSPIDAMIVKHPNKQFEIGLFGFGEEFQKLLTSLKFN